MSLNEVHISSLVVHVLPEHLDQIKTQIETYENAEIYGDSPEAKSLWCLKPKTKVSSQTLSMPLTIYRMF